ncbi:hypothetical protein [Acidovorax sp.]|uniref:hypothetical protein n=1 Tax=Acidovorax sp. TaxID=1872122 RepID=UPI0025C323CF|nr:hypothetical protein [Acidovorax sp.]
MTQATRRKTGGFFHGCLFSLGMLCFATLSEVDMALKHGVAAVGGWGHASTFAEE